MKTYVKALTNIAISILLLLLILFAVPCILIYFSPFVAGWILALIAAPMVRFFEDKVKIKRKAGSAFVIIVVIGLIVLLIYLVGAKLVDEIVGLINYLPSIWASAEQDFDDIGKNFNTIYRRLPGNVQDGITEITAEIGSYVGEWLGKISTPTITAVGNFARSLPSIIIGIIMALLSSYLFVAEKNTIKDFFQRTLPVSFLTRFNMLKRGLGKAVGGYFKAQLKIEIWMYLLVFIGLSVLRVRYAFLIALGIAFLDFFPFFGTGTVMIPWAIIKILSSDYQMAIGLLIIWGGGQLARQLIQPKIVGDSIGVAPIPTLFLLYLGYKLSGVIGMIVAVPVGLIVYTMYEEGAFETTKNSILILAAGIDHFRKLRPEDMVLVNEMQREEAEKKRRLMKEEEDAKH